MLDDVTAQVPDLEGRIARLTAPNRVDGRFSGDKFRVNPDHIRAVSPQLRKDLIVVKASGKLLLDETEPGETLTKREYLVQTMALLSQLWLNIFLIHGGQEQLDREIEESTELSPEVKELANLKNGSVRYTPAGLMPLVISISNGLSDGLKQAIIGAGGNANAYLSSLFIGKQIADFTDPVTQERYGGNSFGYLPLDGRLGVISDREDRVLRYLRGEIDRPGAAPGHILIRGFLVNTADPNQELGAKRKVDPRTREREDPFRRNGDADNIAAATAYHFSSKKVVPVKTNGEVQLIKPERVQLIEIARNGGLRSGPNAYDNIVDVVTSKRDLERQDIEGGMEGKVRTSLHVASVLSRGNVPAIVKIIHVRELLPYLLGNEPAIRSGFGKGYGTTFAPQGLARLNGQFYSHKGA